MGRFHDVMRAAIPCAVVLAAVAGCGGGSGDSGGTITKAATARCVDGKDSFSITCADVCATNGGVRQWLADACQASAPGTASARAFEDRTVTTSLDDQAARVEIAWQAPSYIPADRIVEYHIIRDRNLIGVAPPQVKVFTDYSSLNDAFPASFNYQTPGQSGALETRTATRTAMSVGTSHTYTVSVVYLYNAPAFYLDLALPTADIPATPLARPGAIGPTTDQDLRNVRVSFKTVTGADLYVFEFSTDPSFTNKVTRGPNPVPPNPASQYVSDAFNLYDDFAGLAAGAPVYFRVGARNSHDVRSPLSRGEPNGGDYIYSVPGPFFKKLPTPPAPPSGR